MEKDFSLEGQMKEIFGEKDGKRVFEQIVECAKQLDKEKEATANEVCDKKSNVAFKIFFIFFHNTPHCKVIPLIK